MHFVWFTSWQQNFSLALFELQMIWITSHLKCIKLIGGGDNRNFTVKKETPVHTQCLNYLCVGIKGKWIDLISFKLCIMKWFLNSLLSKCWETSYTIKLLFISLNWWQISIKQCIPLSISVWQSPLLKFWKLW